MGTKAWWVGAVVVLVLTAGTSCTTKKLDDEATADTSTSSTSSTSSSTSTSQVQGSTPKVTFLAQGNAICAEMNRRTDALGSVLDDPNATPQQIADAFDQTVVITSEAVAGLRALPQPPGDEAQLAAMYADVDALIATAAQIGAALRALDQATVESLGDQIATQQSIANAEFNDYGLVECGG